jgi:hypothetical protein
MRIAGLPVVDAPKKRTITITESDVEKGNTKDPAKCAAAQALLREKDCTEARVHIGRTYLKIGKKWVRYHTPESLRGEIISFDRGAMFQPGEYTLTPMQPTKRATGKAQGSPTLKKKVTNPRAKPHVVYGVRSHGANR